MVAVTLAKQSALKLATSFEEAQAAVSGAASELASFGVPAELVKHCLIGKGDLKLGASSNAAKLIYKSPEFKSALSGLDASVCLKTSVRFNKTKALHASFLDCTLMGDAEVSEKTIWFKGTLYDKFDFRKSDVSKVKSIYGKMLRQLGNQFKDLQDAGIARPFRVYVTLNHKLKR